MGVARRILNLNQNGHTTCPQPLFDGRLHLCQWTSGFNLVNGIYFFSFEVDYNISGSEWKVIRLRWSGEAWSEHPGNIHTPTLSQRLSIREKVRSFSQNRECLSFILKKEFLDLLRLQSPVVQINLLVVSDVNAPIPDVQTNPLKLSNVNAPLLDGSENCTHEAK